MLSSKTKTGLSEAIPNKTTPATPRGGKLGKGVTKSNPDSPSPQPNSRLSIDRSLRSVDSKPAVDRRSPRTTGTPDKQPPRTLKGSELKGSELQAQLSQVQDDLKKSKEQLASVEKEKEKALEELKEAKRLAEEATEKVGAAIVAQKRAEEYTEIEKFRADELEQTRIEAVQKKDEEWKKEIDDVRTQHATDVAALLSITEELQRLKHELAMTSDAKNQALNHADDATKIAEIQTEKVEMLSTELGRVKALLDSNLEMKTSESSELIRELNSEVVFLKQELEKAKAVEAHKADAEILIEQLKQELERTKAAETKMVEAEAFIEQLKQELEKAKGLETKVLDGETLIEQLKKELQSAKEVETKMAEAENYIAQLKQELEKAKAVEMKMSEEDKLIEQLTVEVENAKKAELDAGNLVEEWRRKAEHLESRVNEAKQLEKSASDSLATLMGQLEGKSELLEDMEAEVASLRTKLESLELSAGRQRLDLEQSKQQLETVQQKVSEKERMVESLISEIEILKEEKLQAMSNEELAAQSVQTLLEEKNKITNELDSSREEEDKSKKAMESLASALHEVSSEVREAKEKLLSTQTELGNAEAQIEDLKMLLEATNKKYEGLLDEAKHKINLLTDDNHQSKLEVENSKTTWDQKELNFTSSVQKLEEESSYLKKESERLTSLLKEAEGEAQFAKNEGSRLQDALKEAESEVLSLTGIVGEVRSESMKLKERLLDKENELQNITQDNDDLRLREAAALEKIKILEVALTKESEENGDISDSEKDYDMLPSVVEFSEENGIGREEPKHVVKSPSQQIKDTQAEKDIKEDLVEPLQQKLENGNGNYKPEVGDSKIEVVEAKMWESCNIGDKYLSPEKEPGPESFEGEVDSKADDESNELNGSSSTENIENGGTSPTKQQTQKKKKPLLHKFGNLLKKGSTKSK